MKLNRKGYLTVEIILAATMTFVIAYFLTDITIKLVNKTDNYYADTLITTDEQLLVKNIKDEIQADITNHGVISSLSCTDTDCTIIYSTDNTSKRLKIEKEGTTQKITYGDYSKIINKSLKNLKLSGNVTEDYIVLQISGSNIFSNTNHNIDLLINNYVKRYMITYNANGNNVSNMPSQNQEKKHGQSITLSSTVPTRANYTFKNWNTKSDGSGTSYAPGASFDSNQDTNLYAIWQSNTYTLNLNYNLFDSSNKTVAGVTINYDSTNQYVTLNGTATSGFSVSLDSIGVPITASTGYKIELDYISGGFSANAQGGPVFALDALKNNELYSPRIYTDIALPSSTNNHTFGSFTTSASTTNANGLRFWFWVNGRTTFTNYKIRVLITKVDSKSITYGSQIGTLPTPTKTGYTFIGWFTQPNGNFDATYYADTYADLKNAYGYNYDQLLNHWLIYGRNEGRICSATNVNKTSYHVISSDSTAYAGWKVNYYLDLNGWLDGSQNGSLNGYGTCDVYINGSLVEDDVSDYYVQHPYGTTYTINDCKATSGHTYNGLHSGNTSGTITNLTTVYMDFTTKSSGGGCGAWCLNGDGSGYCCG